MILIEFWHAQCKAMQIDNGFYLFFLFRKNIRCINSDEVAINVASRLVDSTSIAHDIVPFGAIIFLHAYTPIIPTNRYINKMNPINANKAFFENSQDIQPKSNDLIKYHMI